MYRTKSNNIACASFSPAKQNKKTKKRTRKELSGVYANFRLLKFTVQRERDRDREGETETETERARETETEIETEERARDRQTDTDRQTETAIATERQTDRQKQTKKTFFFVVFHPHTDADASKDLYINKYAYCIQTSAFTNKTAQRRNYR